MDPNYSRVLQAEVETPLPGRLLTEVHRIYRKQFRRWFGIMAPTSLLAGFVVLLADQRIKAIYRSIPRGEVPYHMADVAATGVLRFGSFFLSWLLGCFALAAIATAILVESGDDRNAPWRSDSFSRAREHMGAIFRVALVTFVLSSPEWWGCYS